MAISETMIAQAFLEYFQQHAEEFEEFFLKRYNIDDGLVSWREDKTNKRLLLTVSQVSQSGEKVSENEYAIAITGIGLAPSQE